MQRSCCSKNGITSSRRSLRFSCGLPAASTPWTWKMDLAVSSPIMVMLIVDGSLCWFKRPALWHIDAVGSRPPHLSRLAQGATSRRQTLLAGVGRAGQRDPDAELATQLALARQTEARTSRLARGIRTLVPWLRHDVLAVAGPDLATRRKLFDFIVAELMAREPEDARRIRPVRVALQNQRDDLLAFAGVLDAELASIARAHAISEPLVREACMLHRLPATSPAYWQGWSGLRARMGGKFHVLFDAVRRAMADTPRSSSLVENLNSPLRTYFTLRRHLGGSYLDLLRFFLNHRRFLRSRHAERQGKSPRELMTGQDHPHWLTLLGLGPLQHRQA